MNDVMIHTSNLAKRYQRYRKREGIRSSITSLWKRDYEEKTAVDHMDLTVKKGELFGLIGPNGAGKTTLIKMLTGIIAPTEGSIDVMGYYPNDLKNEFKKQYAVVMGQKSQLFFELTVNDTLRLFKEIYEIPDKDFQKNKHYFVDLFGVRDLMDVQVRTLSNHLVALITGSIVPLALFPEIIVKIMRLLPFYYVTYLPAMLFTGKCKTDAVAGLIAIALWCLVMQVFINIVRNQYFRKYDGVGI